MAFADYTTATTINSTVPDLSRFQAHGGKLLQWHGWDDPAIAPRSSINYFESVVDAQGNLHRTQEFFRLFLLPGVLHCGGGPGPNVFDFVTPLVSWVETGRAPDRVIATKYVNDTPPNVQTTRPICAFPDFAEFTHRGSSNDASSFICRPHQGEGH